MGIYKMAKSKKVSKSSSKTSTQSASSSSATGAVSEPVAQSTVPTMNDQFNALLATLSSLRSQIASVTSQVRALSKRHDREIKRAQKDGCRKRKATNRAPSGFVKPTLISQ